jgi:hypothetical protein
LSDVFLAHPNPLLLDVKLFEADDRQVTSKYGGGQEYMKILAFLRNHYHYWGVPHPRSRDNRLIQTCYECGAEREIKIELRPSASENLMAAEKGDNLAA